MGGPHPWPGFRRRVEQQGDYIEEVYRRVVDEGPLVAGDLLARSGRRERGGTTMTAHRASRPCSSPVAPAVRRRPQDFARVGDLPGADHPAEALARPALPAHEALSNQRWCVREVPRCRDAAGPGGLSPPHPDGVQARAGGAVEEGRLLAVTVHRVGPSCVPPSSRRAKAAGSMRPVEPVRSGRVVPRPRCGSSASTTGSRSIRRPRSASTATTCCRFCSATSWSDKKPTFKADR